jgi:hypothetical protein
MALTNSGMIKLTQYILSTLLIVLIQLSSHPLVAQQNKQMFMYQVDGNKYEKRSFDNEGGLTSKQIIEAGSVRKMESKYVLPVRISSYDEEGKLEDTYATNYSCDPSSSSLFMIVFPLSDINDNTDVSVRLLSGNDFYPQGIKVNQSLPDISFAMDIEGGVLGFVGANSKIKISDRKIFSKDEESRNYNIKEKVEIKGYVFGFNVRTINYSVEEVFNATKGIIKQEYKKDSGEYFNITLLNP